MGLLIQGVIAAMVATASTANVAPSSDAEKAHTVVLVHGAFVDGSGWQKVYDLLTKRGYEVLVVQNPTVTLEGDIATTRQVIARAKHPVVLVGHSYGGAVITEAGNDSKVQSLVYIAAFAPEAGESVFDLHTRPSPGEDKAPVLPPQDGFLIVDPAKFPQAFAADVSTSTTNFMAAAQVPWGLGAVEPKIANPAWKTKPVYYMRTTNDHMVAPGTQQFMATRAKAKLVNIASSHAVMLSHPDEVADFIETAAGAKK